MRDKLKLPQIVAMYIGAVLGSGILILPGIAAEISGPASLLAWGVMAVLTLPMSLTIGMMASQYPSGGGVAFFVTKAYHINLGSLVGWYFTMAVLFGAPVIALTGAGYFCSAFGLEDHFRLIIAGIILLGALVTNYNGMKITGQIQMAVVITILAVLIISITGSFAKVEIKNFEPFFPQGYGTVGSALTILFWCFLGWEAVANFTAEFKNPQKDAQRGAVIASVIISILYFSIAFVIVGTHSYGKNISEVSLVYLIKNSFGNTGAFFAGAIALFICTAPCIAYTGAVSRMLYSLAGNDFAPKVFSKLSLKHQTPIIALYFTGFCFALLLFVSSTRILTMSTLIQIPNAAFILTYIGAAAAGIKLLKDSKFGILVSIVSFILSFLVFLFVGWSVFFPLGITIIWGIFNWRKKKRKSQSL